MINKRLFSWIHSGLEVRDINNFGKGVFAKTDIKKDTRLTVFGGYVMTVGEESRLPTPINDYSHRISKDLVIGIRNLDDIQPVDYYNHSCNPNAGFKGQIFLVAMRDIKKDEQVTFDYAMVLSESQETPAPYHFKCMCQLKNCRGIITCDDWKIPELQRKYYGFFQLYLQEMIDNVKK